MSSFEEKDKSKEDLAIMKQVRIEIQRGFDVTLKQGKDGTIKVMKSRPQAVSY